MGRPKGSNHQAREKLLEAAGRGFRVGGFGGAGVDGLAKAAGLTSGAFYAHFDSKAEVFRIAVEEGVRFLASGVKAMQDRHGENWLEPFVDFYLGDRMEVDLVEACAVPALSADVARADEPTRVAYETELRAVIQSLALGLNGSETRAWALLSILCGAASMARAVVDPNLKQRLIDAARAAAKSV